MIGLDRIPANGTFLGSVFRERQTKQITDLEWFVASARWASENLHEYHAIQYLPLPDRSRAYISARLNGATDYIQREAIILGEWFKAIIDAHQQNVTRMSNMAWCRDKLMEVKMTDAADRCAAQIRRIADVRFPSEDFRMADEVKIKDQREKGRSTAVQVRG